MFVDTHSHLFAEEFLEDIDDVILRAKNEGVNKILLPNVDCATIDSMLALSQKYPDLCYPCIGLHPTSVKEGYEKELRIIEGYLAQGSFFGLGETGIDLYWDKTFIKEQIEVFEQHLNWSLQYQLPVVIHIRNSFPEVFETLDRFKGKNIRGVFHCFSGDYTQAKKAVDLGYKLGIGGVVTFKNSKLDEVIKKVDIRHIVLETDAPYLAPTPKRGKRNESAYLIYIAQKIADIYNMQIEEIADITTNNALELFKV